MTATETTSVATTGRPSRINPVLARELRSRVKGRRVPIIVTVWLTLVIAQLTLVYTGARAVSRDPFSGVQNVAEIGRGMFGWTLFLMLLALLFLVPAQAAGAIAGERERQTLVPLQLTLMGPVQILVGKVLAGLAFLLFLIVTATPVLAVAFLMGGIRVREVIAGTAAILFAGLTLACLCTAVSTFARRVQTATVLSYLVTLLLVVGTFVLYGAAAVVDSSRGTDPADPPVELLLANPLLFVADVVGDDAGFSNFGSPFDWMSELVRDDQGFVVRDEVGVVVEPAIAGDVFGGDVNLAPDGVRRSDGGVPYWVKAGSFLAAVSALSLLLAARRLRAPAETER